MNVVGYQRQNSIALFRKRIVLTERPSFVSEFLVQTFADRGVSRGQRDWSAQQLILFF
jgi:hypothetical protein